MWLHPAAGWRTAGHAGVTRAELAAVLDSGGLGSEPVVRVRGDAVVMNSTLLAALGAATGVADDFTELRWLRTFAPMASAAQMHVELVAPANGAGTQQVRCALSQFPARCRSCAVVAGGLLSQVGCALIDVGCCRCAVCCRR